VFEGFETRIVPGAGADIFCRIAGSGPPLLALHGYPQTGAMWAGLAPRLAERFTVVVADLRGYGQSAPPDSRSGEHYAKRSMGNDMAAAMRELGHERFRLAGHDRGGRVAYRLALDHPEVVERLAVLDVAPTAAMWDGFDAARALSSYHWTFLAQPNPLPERLIGADPVFYLDHTLASWTANHSTSAFAPDALAEYRRAFNRPEAIHAACEDYRAGATIDREHDEADRREGRRIAAPTLVIWGAEGTPAKSGDPLAAWRPWVSGELSGREVPGGHFVAEEAPEETLEALLAFFA